METTMPELLIDFITSLDGYAAAETARDFPPPSDVVDSP
jgi:hypothetical protein